MEGSLTGYGPFRSPLMAPDLRAHHGIKPSDSGMQTPATPSDIRSSMTMLYMQSLSPPLVNLWHLEGAMTKYPYGVSRGGTAVENR
jgi:hypothetical protein